MSLHYHYEMIVDKAIKSAINDIVQLDFKKRLQIADAFKGVRDEVLSIILPDVYGKAVSSCDSNSGSNAAVPSVANTATVDMVHASGEHGGVEATGQAGGKAKKPSRPAKKGAK